MQSRPYRFDTGQQKVLVTLYSSTVPRGEMLLTNLSLHSVTTIL